MDRGLAGCVVLLRGLVRRIEHSLHGAAPLLKVRRARQFGGVLNGLLGGGEFPVAHAHLFFEFDDSAEERRGLGLGQARDVEQKALDGTALVGKEVFPLVELLVDEGKKRQRQALKDALVQGFLEPW